MSPLRIGLDAREAFRLNPRGIGLYARHLVREFAALCPDDQIVLYHELPPPPDLPALAPNMRPRLATLRGSRFHAWERALMPWCIRKDKIDVYHGTYNTLPPRWPVWPGPPMVVSIHDVIVTWYPESLDDPYVRYCRRVTARVVRQASCILTVSEWSRREILERYAADPAKVRVFYNGVHPDFLADAPGGGVTARQRFADGRPYVLTIGSPLPRKNTGRLLEAIGRLRHRGGFDRLLLVTGLRDQAEPFRARAEAAGISDVVRFLPYLERQELVELYKGADLTVYPSIVEGWGIPVIESLAQGTPVVTSDSSGMREAGGDHASYFDPTDVDDMAERIGHALEHRADFARIRDAARTRARTFTWRRAAEVTLAVYREVCGR